MEYADVVEMLNANRAMLPTTKYVRTVLNNAVQVYDNNEWADDIIYSDDRLTGRTSLVYHVHLQVLPCAILEARVNCVRDSLRDLSVLVSTSVYCYCGR